MNEPLKGYKTFIVAGAMLAYACIGYFLDLNTNDESLRLVFEALGLITLRLGVNKK